MGKRIPSSKTWETKLATAYMLGVRIGSIPSLDLKIRGVDAEMAVGRVEWRKVTGASQNGTDQESIDCKMVRRERGGCVDGVSMSTVRAMSMGARRIPVMPAAPTAVSKLVMGYGDDKTSKPPTADGMLIRYGGDAFGPKPGSGIARAAQRMERMKDVTVEVRTECMNVLLAPFHTPQAPSVAHREERT